MKSRRKFAGLLPVLGAVLIAAFLFVSVIPTKVSSAETYSVKWGKSIGNSAKYLVVQRAQDGSVGICTGDMQGGVGANIPKPQSFTQFRVVAGDPVARNFATHKSRRDYTTVVTSAKSAQLAALLNIFQQVATKDSKSAQSYAYAVSSLLTSGHFRGMGVPDDGGKLARHMLAVANKWAGPYSFDMRLNLGDVARLENIGIHSRTGAWLEDLPLKISLENATFTDGTAVAQLKTTSQSMNLPIRVKPGARVTARIKVEGLPATEFRILEHPKLQDLVVPANYKSAASTVLSLQDKHEFFNPSITTKASIALPDSPVQQAKIVDLVHISTDSGRWVTTDTGTPEPVVLSGTLYWLGQKKIAQSEVIPNHAEVVATRSVKVSGSGQTTVSHREETRVGKPGYYSWVWRIDPALQISDLTRSRLAGEVHEDIGVASQTVFLPSPEPTPEPNMGPSVEPTVEPSVEPGAEPTPEPRLEPSVEPTPESSVEPSLEPSVESRPQRSMEPTPESSMEPRVPTPESSAEQTLESSAEPTAEPGVEPTPEPTNNIPFLAHTGTISTKYLTLSLLLVFLGTVTIQMRNHKLARFKN